MIKIFLEEIIIANEKHDTDFMGRQNVQVDQKS